MQPALFLALACLIGCAGKLRPPQADPTPALFACGPLRCDAERQYCQRKWPAVVPPGTDGIDHQCLALPAPDCRELRDGRCLGGLRTGLTIEYVMP